MSAVATSGLSGVCVKLYAPEPEDLGDDDAAVFVPIFHEWIREKALDLVLFDVADYAHVPDGPGIMLVSHEIAFALDRSDGRFGLLAQRRTPFPGDGAAAIADTLRQALIFAEKLEQAPRLSGKLRFDRTAMRIESNDRLRAPNSDTGFGVLSAVVREATRGLFGDRDPTITRIDNDPRDRLAVLVS